MSNSSDNVFYYSTSVQTKTQQCHRLHSIYWQHLSNRYGAKKSGCNSTRFDCSNVLEAGLCPYHWFMCYTLCIKYAKTRILAPIIRRVYCWEQWRVDAGQKYQMVRWVKCTLLHWWSEQRQSPWLRLFLCGLCMVLLASFNDPPLISQQRKLCIHLQRFGGHIKSESVMCVR